MARFVDKEERREAEMAHGRYVSHRTMVQGLLDQLQSELPGKHSYSLMDAGRTEQWTVIVHFRGTDIRHEEPWDQFPSDVLRTKIMLLSK